MAIEIRTVTEEQFKDWLMAVEAAFAEDIDDQAIERFAKIMPAERALAAWDGESIVGGAAAFPFRLTVPGGSRLPAAGVTAVGVLPTHRRQGILRQMMARQLADARAGGEPLAILWASEGVIYQRFGYGLASLNASIDIERDRAGFRNQREWSGRMRMIDASAAERAFPAVYEAVAARTPGFYERTATWWREQVLADPERWRRGATHKFYILHERDGQPTGYAMYRVKEEWNERGPRSELRVIEAYGVDAEAERDVWRYLFNVDLMHRVTRSIGPVDSPLLLQLAQPGLLGMRLGEGLWLRILDVPAALGARAYAADDELVFELADPFIAELAGRYRLLVERGRPRVERTDAPAELELETNDLAAVYLGGFSFAELARAGRTVERQEGARRRADRMFATESSPWCPEIF